MSVASANKARRSLTEQFEMLYGHSANGSTARPGTRSPSGLNGGGRALSPQQYRPTTSASGVMSAGYNPHHYSDPNTGGGSGVNSFAFLHETIRNHATELELERRTREAAVRDLSARTSVEIGELREMIKQLRGDNNALKEQVWNLERRKSPLGGAAGGATSGALALPADSYFGGATALNNVQLPLIPRVTDLERDVEQIRQKVNKLQATEKSREESLQKSLVEQQVQLREMLDNAKEFARSECDRREASRMDPLEQQVRDLANTQQDSQRSVARSHAESATFTSQLGERVRANEEAIAMLTDRQQTHSQLEEWKRLMKASAEVEADKVKSSLADIKAEVAKAVRKQEAGDLEVQEALQSFTTQRLDVVRAEMLPREEMAKLNSLVSAVQRDVDRAADAAQASKIAAEETKREVNKRVAVLEADASSTVAKVNQMGNDISGNAQALKTVATSLDDVKTALKATQSSLGDANDRITSQGTKLIEHATTLDTLGQDVSRLKALQAAHQGTESSERQQLKERLHVAEDEVKTLKGKLSAMDEAQQAHKKDADRAFTDLKSTVGAEERATNQIAQQKMLSSLAALEGRIGAVDDRCTANEASAQKVRDELMTALRTKVDDAKESFNNRVSECDELCKGRQREVKEALSRVEEKSNNVAVKTKAIEVSIGELPTVGDVERAAIDVKDGLSKTISRMAQEQAKETNAIREELSAVRMASDKGIADLQTEVKTRALDVASKALVEDLRVRVEDAVAAIDQTEATMSTTIHKTVKDRIKPLQDAQAAQKEEFDEFQSLMSELAQRLKSTVATLEQQDMALKEQEKALEASDKSRASVLNELMMAVSVACSHEQQFGANNSPAGESTALTAAPATNISSLGDVIQYILNCVADAQQELQEQVQGLEALRSASEQPQQPPVTEDDVHAALQSVSVPLMELTKIVDRHEKGFSIIPELVQGIRFNNKGLIGVATALGVSTDGLKVRSVDDSELHEALSEAADDTREREYEITEKERHWM